MDLTQHLIAFGLNGETRLRITHYCPLRQVKPGARVYFWLEANRDLTGLAERTCQVGLLDFVTGSHRLWCDDELVGANVLVAVADVKA